MNLRRLPLANLAAHLGRSIGLAALVGCLSFALLGGVLVVRSLQSGLDSLQNRLGADLIVAPKSASTTTDLTQVLVDGVPKSFYMDRSYVEKIAAREGVAAVSPQYYLATVKAGCCAMPLQIIGIDPATDFTIQPWIDHSYSQELGFRDMVVGCNITGAPGTNIMFYGHECRIVAKLDETGTALDNAVFCTPETIADLIEGSREQGISALDELAGDPANVVSTIQVRVADGHSVTDVVNDINLHVRGAYAVAGKAMTADVAGSMAGVSRVIGILVAVVWVVAVAVLAAAFAVVARQRAREFAVLRVLGASRRMLAGVVLRESALVAGAGALVGTVLAGCLVLAFGAALEGALGLPFLLPVPGALALYGLAAFALATGVATGVSVLGALRLARVDAGTTLRSE